MVFNLFKFFENVGFKSSGRKGSVTSTTKQNIDYEWKNIAVLLEQKGPSQMRQALITADKTLDNALRDIVAGETMGDRLKNSTEIFDRDLYDRIWQAHKMRNSLVHESGYEPPHHMILASVNTLKKALIVLGLKI